MSDLFHKNVPFEFIDKVMVTIQATPQHRYQLLTKRAERMAEYFSTRPVPGNVWLGVTVECQASKFRIDHLKSYVLSECPCPKRREYAFEFVTLPMENVRL